MPSPTSRQLNFIRSLRAERTPEQFQQALSRACIPAGYADMLSDCVTSRQASLLIDALMAQPRSASTPQRQDGEEIHAPSAATRAGRMLRAGSIEATVTFDDGSHVTLRVRTRAPQGRGWTNAEPGTTGARTSITVLGSRVGWINVNENGQWWLTLRTRNEATRRAIHALFEYAAMGDCAGGERVQEASRCGRCMRTLTDPVSIDRGIGPECYGRSTGSHHADTMSVGDRAEEVTENVFAMAAEALQTPTPQVDIVEPVRPSFNYSAADIRRAQELVAEALDAYCEEDVDSRFAINVFKAMAVQVQPVERNPFLTTRF